MGLFKGAQISAMFGESLTKTAAEAVAEIAALSSGQLSRYCLAADTPEDEGWGPLNCYRQIDGLPLECCWCIAAHLEPWMCGKTWIEDAGIRVFPSQGLS